MSGRHKGRIDVERKPRIVDFGDRADAYAEHVDPTTPALYLPKLDLAELLQVLLRPPHLSRRRACAKGDHGFIEPPDAVVMRRLGEHDRDETRDALRLAAFEHLRDYLEAHAFTDGLPSDGLGTIVSA